jgi:hypothetical protein
MSGWRGLILAAGIVAAASAASRAAEPELHAKPGLWQVTMTAHIKGEGLLDTGAKTQVIEQCHNWHNFAFGDADQTTCKKPVISRTARSVDMHLECNGEERSSHLQIIAPEKFVATSMMLWGGMRQETSYQGKWLGRNCKGLQPLD